MLAWDLDLVLAGDGTAAGFFAAISSPLLVWSVAANVTCFSWSLSLEPLLLESSSVSASNGGVGLAGCKLSASGGSSMSADTADTETSLGLFLFFFF